MLSENNRALLNEKPTRELDDDLVGWVYAELPEVFQDYVDRVALENNVSQLDLYPLMFGIQRMLRVSEQSTSLLRVVQIHYAVQDFPLAKAC